MKATDTPAQCLTIAKTMKSTMETEKLSKSFLQNISKPEMSDILVFESSQEEHDANVIRFMERCLEINLHLNPEKVRMNCMSVPFFGMMLTENGIKPDPKKIEAIKNWPVPQNVTELQSLLGSVNYLSCFIAGLCQLHKPLQV